MKLHGNLLQNTKGQSLKKRLAQYQRRKKEKNLSFLNEKENRRINSNKSVLPNE